MEQLRTQVAIIGAGPAGLLLRRLLHQQGISTVVLERQSGDYVRARVRAGVLESRSVEILDRAGVSDRLHEEAIRVSGHHFMWDNSHVRIAFDELVDHTATVYGQTKITRDLMDACEADGAPCYYEAANVQPHDIESDSPYVTFTFEGKEHRLDCDFIAGCDGAHGVSRTSVPAEEMHTYDESFPFAWLAILSDTPPVSEEVVWVNHPEGFVMCSFRSHTRSRYYFQVPATEKVSDWDADAFWKVLAHRLPDELSNKLVTGPALEMSVTPLRSTVTEPIRYGRLFLAGDSAHVVPPIGAKGLNLAIGDVAELADAFTTYFRDGNTSGLDGYSEVALRRIWQAVRFSWWMANLMHKYTDDPVERRLQISELEYIGQSRAAQETIAENFCGTLK